MEPVSLCCFLFPINRTLTDLNEALDGLISSSTGLILTSKYDDMAVSHRFQGKEVQKNRSSSNIFDEWGLEGSSWLLGSFWVLLGPSWGEWIPGQYPMRKGHIMIMGMTMSL